MSDLAAFGALILSAIALGSQGIAAYRRRRRLIVTVGSSVTATVTGSELHNRQYLVVKLRAIGGSIGVEQVLLGTREPSPNFGWTLADGPFFNQNPPVSAADALGEARVIQEGEVITRVYRVTAPQSNHLLGVDVPLHVNATVLLTNGKSVVSDFGLLMPDTIGPNFPGAGGIEQQVAGS